MTIQLQGRELDAALAKALGVPVRSFSADLNAMHKVEAEIERRELVLDYIYKINMVVHGEIIILRSLMEYDETIDGRYLPYGINEDGIFALIHATAEQRARAALMVLS